MKKSFSLSISNVWWIFAALGLAIYSNTFGSSLVGDDPFVITQNASIRHLDLSVLWHAFNTRFIVGLSLAFNYALGKENVVGYHLFNTLIHILNAFFVYKLICLTPKTSKLLGFLVALIFLVHPVQTQAVTYIWQRATSLATFFYLGALVFYVRGRLNTGSSLLSPISYLLCLLFAVLGMFTKEIVFTLPFAILLYEVILLREIPLKTKQKMVLWIPLAVTLCIIPWTMTQTNIHTLDIIRPAAARVSHEGQGAVQHLLQMTRTISADKVSRKEFLLTEMNVLRTYLRLFILPVNQNVDYDYPKARSLVEPNTLLSFLLLLSLFGAGFLLLKKHPLLSFGIFWFFLTVSVEALVAQEEFIFEHRMYLPMVGLSLFLVAGLSYFLKTPKRLTWVILGIVACFSFLTYQRNFVWRDEFTLMNDSVHKSPRKGRPYYNRGNAYQTKGRLKEALKDYNKAIELNPDFVDPYIDRAILYEKKGSLDLALADLNKAAELRPDYSDAYRFRGSVYQKKGLPDLALADLNKAIELNRFFPTIYYNRALLYQQKGLSDLVLADLNKAIELDSDYSIAYYARATIVAKKGFPAQALSDFNNAKRLGLAVDPKLIEALEIASGKNK